MKMQELDGADFTKVVIRNDKPYCKIHGAMLTQHTGIERVYRCMTSVGRKPCKNLYGGQPELNQCRAGCVIIQERDD